MLNFRFTCEKHRQVFIAAAKRGGCHEPARMDEVRRKTLAWLSQRYPRAVLDHFNEASCIACMLEANGIDLGEVEKVVTELACECRG